MKLTISLEDILNLEDRISREQAVEAGFYDGRFAPRKERLKPRHDDKYACRKNKGRHRGEFDE